MATMKFSKKVSYLAIAGAAVVPANAWAQVLTNPIPVLPSDYPSERVSVSERYRPEFQASGIPLGTLTVLPQVGVGGNYTSNVFGTATGAQNDFWLGVDPSLTITKRGGNEDTASFQAKVDAALRRFADQKAANETGLGGEVSATLPMGNGNYLAGGASARRNYERQDSGSFPSGALAPIRYAEYIGYLRFRAGGSRIRATVAADVDKTQFNNARLTAGTSFDQGFRDRTVLRGTGRVEASVTGATSGFVEGRYSNINYTRSFITPGVANRDGDQYEGLAGLRVDAGKLRGTVAAGYTRRVFDSPLYRDFGGFALTGQMVYYASGLTTVTLNGFRNIAESGDPNISAQFTTGVNARVDHELLRYIILSGTAGYNSNSYQGINRTDKLAIVRGSVRYLANRHSEINAEAGYTKRTSSGAAFGPEYNRFEFGVNLVGRL